MACRNHSAVTHEQKMDDGVRRWKMFYFTKRSTRLAFSGLSEMFSISRHT
jgi:hypothetical protein